MWHSATDRVMALAQFRHNIIVATGPATHSTMSDVCNTLTDMWSLRVLCPCIKKPKHPCILSCVTQDLQALEYACTDPMAAVLVWLIPLHLLPIGH